MNYRLLDIAISEARGLAKVAGELPVNARALAERLGVEYHEQTFSPEVDGLYFRTSDNVPHAYVNRHWSKPEGRRLFTAAHEIGHHTIAQHVTFTQMHFLDSLHSKLTPLEIACNRFAAELLMPEAMIRQWHAELYGNPQYRANIIADRCGVSAQAVEIRLKQLKLQARR